MLARLLVVIILFFPLHVLGTAPSFVSDYSLKLVRLHDGVLHPLPDGTYLARNISQIDGEPVDNVLHLDQNGDPILPTNLAFEKLEVMIGGKLIPQSLNPSFNLDPRVHSITSMAADAEGNLFFVGAYTVDGVTRKVGKLDSSGTLDTTFDCLIDGFILTNITAYDDTSVLLSGLLIWGANEGALITRIGGDGAISSEFTNYYPSDLPVGNHVIFTERLADGNIFFQRKLGRIGLLGPDGTPLDTVLPQTNSGDFTTFPASDGTLYLFGDFTEVGGVARDGIAKITPNGQLDMDFHPAKPERFDVLADDTLLFQGDFTEWENRPRWGFAHLDADGTLLEGFSRRYSAEGIIERFAQFQDGSILVQGVFDSVIWNDQFHRRESLLKLDPFGVPDFTFQPDLGGHKVTTAMVRANDRIILGFQGATPAWKEIDKRGNPGADLPADWDFLDATQTKIPAILADGSLSFFAREIDRGRYRRVVLTPEDELSIFHEMTFVDPSFSGITERDGWTYMPKRDEVLTIDGISPEGIPSFNLIRDSSGDTTQGGATALGLFPANRLLVATAPTIDSYSLTAIDTRGNIEPNFEGPVIGGGQVNHIWSDNDRQQYFISGRFSEIDGIDTPAFAQIRIDGSLETDFDLGTGIAYAPRQLVRLKDGRILVGGFGKNFIDGITVEGIAMLDPVPQKIFSRPQEPGGVSAAATSPFTVFLAWDSTPGADEFRIERMGEDESSWEIIAHLRLNQLTYEDFVRKDLTYRYRVTAMNLAGVTSTETEVVTPDVDLNGGQLLDERIDLLLNAGIDQILRLNSGRYLVAGRITIAGRSQIQDGNSLAIIRINADGSHDASFTPVLFPTQPEWHDQWKVKSLFEQDDGKVMIGLQSGLDNALSRINADGSFDDTFPEQTFSGDITAIEKLPDGNLLIVGNFAKTNEFGSYPRVSSMIINSNGAIVSEAWGGGLSEIETLTRANDGGFVVSGRGGPVWRVSRFNPDGSLDETFGNAGAFQRQPGVKSIVGIHVFETGEILVGGNLGTWRWFVAPEGSPGFVETGNLAILNPDGSLNMEKTAGLVGISNSIEAIGSLPSGKGLVAGDFNQASPTGDIEIGTIDSTGNLIESDLVMTGRKEIQAVTRQRNGELFISGTFGPISEGTGGGSVRILEDPLRIDPSFHTELFRFDQDFGGAFALKKDFDGGLFVGGRFDLIRIGTDSHQTNNLGRINPDGTIDHDFSVFDILGTVLGLDQDSQGRLIVGGNFLSGDRQGPDGRATGAIARLNEDGSLDTSFASEGSPDGAVRALLVDENDRIYITGFFENFGTESRRYIARLDISGNLDSSFDPDSSAMLWNGYRSMTIHNGLLHLEGTIGGFSSFDLAGIPQDFTPSFSQLAPAVLRSMNPSTLLIGGGVPANQPDFSQTLTAFEIPGSNAAKWEIPFDQSSIFQGISKGEAASYLFGALSLANRETSVLKIDPETGFEKSFEAGSANLPPRIVEEVGDRLIVGGSFSSWENQPRYGLAVLQSGAPSLFPSSPILVQGQSSQNRTVLTWETNDSDLAYRIESRTGTNEPWETIGVRDGRFGAFRMNKGVNDGPRSFRVIAISEDGSESLPSEMAEPSPVTFTSWKLSLGLSAEQSEESDRDGDGIPLLVEYALNLDPRKSFVPNLLTYSDGVAEFKVVNHRPNVQCFIQVTDDMRSWETVANSFRALAALNPVTFNSELTNHPTRQFRVLARLID